MVNVFCLRTVLKKLGGSSSLKDKNYLFITIRSFDFVLHQELFLANILARNGAQVVILLDDGCLEHWDTYQIHHSNPLNPSRSIKHKLKRELILNLYKHSNIKILYLSSLLSPHIQSEEDMSDFEPDIISSVRRYFECGYCDLNDPNHRKYYEKSRQNALKMKYASQILNEKYVFDAVITSHGIYSIWGIARQYFKKKSVPVYVYGAHAYGESHLLFTDTVAQTLSKDASWLEFVKENKNIDYGLVDEYFDRRVKHKTKDTSIYYAEVDTQNEIQINRGTGKNYAIFPNLIWDGDIVQKDTIFNGMLDWMVKTIEYFIVHNKNNLIIRFHPAESTLWKGSVKMSDILFKRFSNLRAYPNIYVIDSDRKIDVYSFIRKNVDVGLVYDGILSLEMTYMKIPVISPSSNRYTGGNFVISPKSLDSYYKLLDEMPSFNDCFSDSKTEEFYKYAFWFLFKAAYYMPIYSTKRFGTIVYNKNTIENIYTPDFKRLVDRLLNL